MNFELVKFYDFVRAGRHEEAIQMLKEDVQIETALESARQILNEATDEFLSSSSEQKEHEWALRAREHLRELVEIVSRLSTRISLSEIEDVYEAAEQAANEPQTHRTDVRNVAYWKFIEGASWREKKGHL